MTKSTVAFIGGGNMASAIIGGLIAGGRAPGEVIVVEPVPEQRAKLAQTFGLEPQAAAGPALAAAETVVWAVKPQFFAEAAAPAAPFVAGKLQLSVMAGIRTEAIVRAIDREGGSAAVVRAMPNTPALIGRGIAGLYARPEVTDEQRQAAEALLAPTGQVLWVEREELLDPVTALSGSGPAYVFYLLEAMMEAAAQLGLTPEQGRRLALATVDGAAALALKSPQSPAELRAQVTSKGGTTHAAISSLDAHGVKAALVQAIVAASRRAAELGAEFGRQDRG